MHQSLLVCLAVLATPLAAQPAFEAPGKTVSADLLRQPLRPKARQMLLKALSSMHAGDHPDAIRRLEETLAKYPDSAAWTQSLLGVEYLKTDQFAAAVDSLDEAVRLLPRDPGNHYNLGLALVSEGQYDRAEPELRRALELDRHDEKAKRLLDGLLNRRLARNN